jgi:hypothetical protein
MTTLAYSSGMPTPASTSNFIAAPEIVTAFNNILAWANGNIDGVNVAAALTGRRLVMQAHGFVGSNVAANTLFFAADGTFVVSGASSGKAVSWAYLDPAGFAVTGKTNTQLVLRLSVATNTIAPTMNFTAQLNAVTFAGSAGALVPTIGAQSGTGAVVTAPTASSATVAETAPFTFPAAGAFAPVVVLSGATASNSGQSLLMQLFALNS